MRYYKIIIGGYIIAVGVGDCGTVITQEEYDQIVDVINHKPEGDDYKLREDLTWEGYDGEPYVPTITDAEALEIILGV